MTQSRVDSQQGADSQHGADRPRSRGTAGDRAEGQRPVRVLLVDDEPSVVQALSRLVRGRYATTAVTSPHEALRHLGRDAFDVVVSDLRMPELDGISFLARVRDLAPTATRLLLTGHLDVDDAIKAVNVGQVFRFLLKPCPPDELLSALEEAVAEHRRLAGTGRLVGGGAAKGHRGAVEAGDLRIDKDARSVTCQGRRIDLPRREFDLLAYLVERAGDVCSRGDLLAGVWHSASDWQDPATVTEHVRRLRQRLGEAGAGPAIETVRGVGYRFVG